MKRSSWAELIILPVSLAGLSICWLSLWQQWVLAVGGATGPRIAPVLMLAVLVAGTFITRWAVAPAQSNLQLQRPQRIVVISGLVAVVAVLWITFGSRFPFDYLGQLTEWKHLISPELLALGVAGLLWWRAIYLGRDEDLHASAQREFSGGIIALAALFVFNKVNPQIETAQAFWPVVIFFALGLGSLALAGLEQDREIQAGSTGVGLGINRHWLGTVGVIIGFILTGAIILAALASPETIATLDPLLDWVGVTLINVIGTLLYFAASVLLPLGEMLGRILWPLLKLFVGLSASFKFPGLGPTPEQVNDVAQRLARTPPFRAIEIVISVLVLIILFRLAVRRLRLLRGKEGEEELHESIFSRDLVWEQLRDLFKRRGGATSPPLPPYLALDGEAGDPRLRVRQAYQLFLQWAVAQDYKRLPYQTPAHLAETLGNALPHFKEEIATLTRTYVLARYGPQISSGEADEAQSAIRRLRGEGLGLGG